MGKSNKVCPNCGRKMKCQFNGLQHCECGLSWSRHDGYFERTGDMGYWTISVRIHPLQSASCGIKCTIQKKDQENTPDPQGQRDTDPCRFGRRRGLEGKLNTSHAKQGDSGNGTVLFFVDHPPPRLARRYLLRSPLLIFHYYTDSVIIDESVVR